MTARAERTDSWTGARPSKLIRCLLGFAWLGVQVLHAGSSALFRGCCGLRARHGFDCWGDLREGLLEPWTSFGAFEKSHFLLLKMFVRKPTSPTLRIAAEAAKQFGEANSSWTCCNMNYGYTLLLQWSRYCTRLGTLSASTGLQLMSLLATFLYAYAQSQTGITSLQPPDKSLCFSATIPGASCTNLKDNFQSQSEPTLANLTEPTLANLTVSFAPLGALGQARTRE